MTKAPSDPIGGPPAARDATNGWRHIVSAVHFDATERSKNMHHYPPAKRRDGALVMEIFGKLNAMADDPAMMTTPAPAGQSTPSSPPDGSGRNESPHSQSSSIAPLQTLVISGRAQREQLEQADRATQHYRQLDADFLRGDELARIFYGCTSDDAGYELREMSWRYTRLDFLWRFVLSLDEYCYHKKPRDERVCCGVLDPRMRFDLFQILHPDNWSAAHGCPYTEWEQFVRDYNNWGAGSGPRPRWLPSVPGTSKKAAEDVVFAYLVTGVTPICHWFFGPDGPPLHSRLLAEQFMMRGSPAMGLESAATMIRRCINGNHDPHAGFYDVALQMWSEYATYVPGVVEMHLQQHDLADSTRWVSPLPPDSGGARAHQGA